MGDMLTHLETYYRSKGILATNFTCLHKQECSGTSEKFTGPKSAFASTGYERGDLPRLLFLSLDSGSGDEAACRKLPHAVRQGGESMNVARLPKHKHWYRTHEIAWYILREFDPNLEIERINRYFAHANSAKCCQNKPSKSQADSILFRNCRRYLAGEIQVLRPDIVVTQGDWAKWGVNEIAEVQDQIDNFARTIRFDGRVLFWLHTYHPAAFGKFNAQRDGCRGWEKYSKKIKDFMYRTRAQCQMPKRAPRRRQNRGRQG